MEHAYPCCGALTFGGHRYNVAAGRCASTGAANTGAASMMPGADCPRYAYTDAIGRVHLVIVVGLYPDGDGAPHFAAVIEASEDRHAVRKTLVIPAHELQPIKVFADRLKALQQRGSSADAVAAAERIISVGRAK
jgi:hypothetical protein